MGRTGQGSVPFGSAWRLPVLATVLLVLGACGLADLERFAPERERAFAPGWIDALRHGDTDAIRAPLDDSLRDDESLRTIDSLPSFFPDGDPGSSKLVGAGSNYHDGVVDVTLTYECSWPGAWVLATVVTRRAGEGDPFVIGVHIKPLEAPLEEANAFTVHDKPVGHFVMLAIAGLVPLTILATFIAVLAARGLQRKWVWALGVLFGFGSVSLDWSSGEWEVSPPSVYMLGSGVSRAGPYAPWVLSTSVPIVALLYLFGRRRNPEPAALPDRSA